VPGGRARYPSTVLMTVVPARAAGVDEVVLCTPPGPDGQVPAETLAAAAIAGADEVYRIGGAQAIGALAHGTESIRPVDVIVGPGNVYVSQAKRQVTGLVGVPAAFAGPSEVVVVGDDTVPAELCATDIVVQAEHGPGGLAWLITWSDAVADAVEAAIAAIVAGAQRRADIEATLADGGYTVLVDGPEAAMAVANAIAPEHLQLMTADPSALVPLVRNAGAVFCGPWSPAALGDYAAGPSHVLPTFGSARYAGALSVLDFLKQIHVVTADEAGLARLGPVVETLAAAEGLPGHAAAIAARRAPAP
jgi:histidinol dehydrogenase